MTDFEDQLNVFYKNYLSFVGDIMLEDTAVGAPEITMVNDKLN